MKAIDDFRRILWKHKKNVQYQICDTIRAKIGLYLAQSATLCLSWPAVISDQPLNLAGEAAIIAGGVRVESPGYIGTVATGISARS